MRLGPAETAQDAVDVGGTDECQHLTRRLLLPGLGQVVGHTALPSIIRLRRRCLSIALTQEVDIAPASEPPDAVRVRDRIGVTLAVRQIGIDASHCH